MRTLAVIAITLFAGCQTGAPSAPVQSEEQPLSDCFGQGNFCGQTSPKTSGWTKGMPLPASTPTTVIMLMPDKQGVWFAAGADPAAGKVLWVVSLKDSQLSDFMPLVGSSNYQFGGVRPPPPVDCPPICGNPDGALLLEMALRVSPTQGQSEAAAMSCKI